MEGFKLSGASIHTLSIQFLAKLKFEKTIPRIACIAHRSSHEFLAWKIKNVVYTGYSHINDCVAKYNHFPFQLRIAVDLILIIVSSYSLTFSIKHATEKLFASQNLISVIIKIFNITKIYFNVIDKQIKEK